MDEKPKEVENKSEEQKRQEERDAEKLRNLVAEIQNYFRARFS